MIPTTTPNIQKSLVYVQEWEESELGWGQRADGYSLHRYHADIAQFVHEYWSRMPDRTPEEYSRPCGSPFTGYITTAHYEKFFQEQTKGVRLCSRDYSALILELAEHYATEYHKGQIRCKTAEPFITHPQTVVNLLKEYGYEDPATKCIAWLHDTVEDTNLTIDEITEVFGKGIAEGVHLLTRDVPRDAYNKRILAAPRDIQVIKLCDIIHNSMTLEVYTPEFALEKITEYKKVYVPLAKSINADIANRLLENMNNYLSLQMQPAEKKAVEQ